MSLPIETQSEYIAQVQANFLKSRNAGIIPVDIYDYLVENGSIDLDDEEKREIRRYVEEKLTRSKVNMKGAEWKNLVGNKAKYETHVRNDCKRQAVANFFTREYELDNF